MPYVYHAARLTAELNTLVKAAKEREFGARQARQAEDEARRHMQRDQQPAQQSSTPR